MKKKITEAQLVDMIKFDDKFQAETNKIIAERMSIRENFFKKYDVTSSNYYIRKKKYLKAVEKQQARI